LLRAFRIGKAHRLEVPHVSLLLRDEGDNDLILSGACRILRRDILPGR
jgi:hypothetical protein